MQRALCLILVAGCLAFVGCSPRECDSESECGSGKTCFLGSCIPKPQEGDGGHGGSGGTTSSGGEGGEDAPPTAESISVELFADTSLSKILRSHKRTVQRLRIRAVSRGIPSSGDVDLAGPFEWRAASPDSNVMYRLDAAPIEVPLDEPVLVTDPIELTVEVQVAPRSGDESLFAKAQVLATASGAPAPVLLTLDPTFDYDGDGLPDLDDCAPSGPVGTEEPGLCDGADSSCTLGLCHLPIPAASGTITGMRCHGARCFIGTSGVNNAGGGWLVFDSSFDGSDYQLIEGPLEVLQFAIVEEGGEAFLIARDEVEGAHRLLDDAEADWEYLDLSSAIGTPTNFVRGETHLYVAANRSLSALIPTASDWMNCGARTCLASHFHGLSGRSLELALRPISPTLSDVFVRLEDNRAIVVLRMSEDAIEDGLIPTIEVLTQETPRSIEWSLRHEHLYVVGGEEQGFGEGAIVSADRTITPFSLPPGVCPSALRVLGDLLLVADDCQAALWELPIRASGVPDHLEARRIHLLGCQEPYVLEPQATASDPILVGCRDREDRFFVVNRD